MLECMPSLQQSPILMALQLSRDNIRKQAAKTEANAQNGVKVISELEEQLDAAGQKYVTLQKIKAYIADLCDMLQVCAFAIGSMIVLIEECISCCSLFSSLSRFMCHHTVDRSALDPETVHVLYIVGDYITVRWGLWTPECY